MEEDGIADHVSHDSDHEGATDPGDDPVEDDAEDGDTTEPGIDDLDDDDGAYAIATE